MNRYFGYMVPKADGTHDIVVQSKAADAAVLAEFEKLTGVIGNLQPLAIALAVTERELMTVLELPDDQANRLDQFGNFDMSMAVVVELMVESTQVLNGFLASASALLGQAEKYVARAHGAENSKSVAWHTRRRELHAKSSGYRILYDLRNFAQHYALPVTGMNVRGELDATEGVAFTTDMCLSRDDLLSSGYEWGHGRPAIEAQDPVFDVRPLAKEYVACLRDLVGMLASYRASELVECREYLKVVRRVLEAPPNAKLWLFDHETEQPPRPPSKGQIVPEEQFLWTLNTLLRDRLAGLSSETGSSR